MGNLKNISHGNLKIDLLWWVRYVWVLQHIFLRYMMICKNYLEKYYELEEKK